MKSLYDKLFTEYTGHLGYAPAIATITVCIAACCGLIYGSVVVGKAAFAEPVKKAAIVVVVG